MERPTLNFSARRTVPILYQAEMAECGLTSLAMIANYYGYKTDMPSMRYRFSAGRGMTLAQLMTISEQLGLAGRALKCELVDLPQLHLPCILHWDLNHFVVLVQIQRLGRQRRYIIHDPATGRVELDDNNISEHFTGVCLELRPTEHFRTEQHLSPPRLSQLWSKMSGLYSGLASVIFVSFVMQLLLLAGPYYLQWTVDEALLSQDANLLLILAIGFGALAIFVGLIQAIRSWWLLRLSSLLNAQLGLNVFHHLLTLPLNYFLARHTGDVLSRFGSLGAIRERITQGVVEILVDGVMALLVIVMLLIYSWQLTAVIIATVVLYGVMRGILFGKMRAETIELIKSQADEQTHFIESVKSIQAIKLYGGETNRLNQWQHRYFNVINSEIRLGRLTIGFDVANKIIFGLENVIVIYLAAHMILNQQMTIGMLMAVVAYKNQFVGQMTRCIEQWVQFRLLNLHLTRLADITATDSENHLQGGNMLGAAAGRIELENIGFSHPNCAPLFSNINLIVEAGESIVITGKSGQGKSTLLKIMLGLIEPSEGRVLFDGVDIRTIGLQNYRTRIGAVMQDDDLLTGSLLANICMFDEQPDFERAVQCARNAQIEDDIVAMPMAYQTQVGDLGCIVSGGQRQRILLARALYSQPTVMFLDEATSQLDAMNESQINSQISTLNITRIMVAHRTETIALADKAYRLTDGALTVFDRAKINKCP